MIDHINDEIYQYVLEQKELNVNFQPIVSISKRNTIGFESLLRAYHFGEFISPEALFSYAKEREDVITLDSICQNKALIRYQEHSHNKLLFINIETSLLEYYIENVDFIIQYTDNLKIPRGKIVIEINEKRADNNSRLVDLVNVYRKAGFLIALDDVGAGYSNLNRIVLAKPDIIKVDRSVISNIDKNYYKQEVLRAITDLGQKIGAIAIAEGVEEENEVITCVSCGVDWFQGYYFSKAVDPKEAGNLLFDEKCKTISYEYQRKVVNEMTDMSFLVNRRKTIFNDLLTSINSNHIHEMEDAINSYLTDTDEIECVYVIDRKGMQVTDTIFNRNSRFKNQEMFSPMRKGDFHISKPFYNYALQKRNKIYVSIQYISLATGNFCQTLSKCFQVKDEKEFIICVDFVGPE